MSKRSRQGQNPSVFNAERTRPAGHFDRGRRGNGQRLIVTFAFMAALPTAGQTEDRFGVAPSCVQYGPRADEHCINNDALTIEAVNGCDRTLEVKICIAQRNGKLDCGSDTVRVGKHFSYYTCKPTGRYGVQARVAVDAAHRSPKCPDRYYNSALTGKCVECTGIWLNGNCIYD